MLVYADMEGSLRLDPWKGTGLLLHGSSGSLSGAAQICLSLPSSPHGAGLPACE